ncbi:MAG: enoyl-CoA hydratase/isomerase family protein [Acidobacteria bacterium]|nr:enoyl-CoA hydratase/isomerase family protein [Acidobacteriota bacterium]
MTVHLDHSDLVSTVNFEKPPMNLLTLDDMRSLVEAHQLADAHPNTRVIITRSGVPGMFSNGLDPHYVLSLTNTQRIDVFQGVADMFCALVHLKKPHLAVIEGPAMAGGAILALTADYRGFEVQKGRISFSEPKVGLPIPQAVVKAIASVVPSRYLRDVVMLAANLDAPASLEFGLADAVGNEKEIQTWVETTATRLARLSPAVVQTTKATLRHSVRESAQQFAKDLGGFATFVGDAFLGEGLRALVENRHPNYTR